MIIAESVEENANPSIAARHAVSIKNDNFRMLHVGLFTPGARAPISTAFADEISSPSVFLFSMAFSSDLL